MVSCHNKPTPTPKQYDITSDRYNLLIGDVFKDGSNVTVTSKKVKDGYILNFFKDSIKVREMFISNGPDAEGKTKIIYSED